jgi:hypothetical protein
MKIKNTIRRTSTKLSTKRIPKRIHVGPLGNNSRKILQEKVERLLHKGIFGGQFEHYPDDES